MFRCSMQLNGMDPTQWSLLEAATAEYLDSSFCMLSAASLMNHLRLLKSCVCAADSTPWILGVA